MDDSMKIFLGKVGTVTGWVAAAYFGLDRSNILEVMVSDKTALKQSQTINIQYKREVEKTKNDRAEDKIAYLGKIDSSNQVVGEITKKYTGLKSGFNNVHKSLEDERIRTRELQDSLKLSNFYQSDLENMLDKSEEQKNILSKNLEVFSDSLGAYKELLQAKQDTLNLAQGYLNMYMINRRPIKDKNSNKVYLDMNERNLPLSQGAIKAIRAKNKVLRNQSKN